MHHFIAICEFKLKLQSGSAQFGSKSSIFWPVWSWTLIDDIEKQWGTSSLLLQFCPYFNNHLWIQTGVTILKYPNWGQNLLWPLWPWPLTSDSDLCMDFTFVNGDYSWQFHGDMMAETYLKRCDRQTDRCTDRTVHRAAWSQLKKQLGHLQWNCS